MAAVSQSAPSSHPATTRYAGTRAEAAKMPIFAVTPTEVLETMHHCMPSDA
jgi:hypothetical protein